jgi:hypothetical protein
MKFSDLLKQVFLFRRMSHQKALSASKDLRSRRSAIMKISILLFYFVCFTGLLIKAQDLPHFYVRANNLTAINDNDRKVMTTCIEIFENIMNDTGFQKELLDTTFEFDKDDDPMRFLTPKQVVDTLFSGREWYHTYVDHTAEVNWEATKRVHKPPFTTTIGYGNSNDSLIYTYIFYIRNYTIADVTGNLAHEWSHKVGFDHKEKDHPGRDETVPYIFGNLVEKYVVKYTK